MYKLESSKRTQYGWTWPPYTFTQNIVVLSKPFNPTCISELHELVTKIDIYLGKEERGQWGFLGSKGHMPLVGFTSNYWLLIATVFDTEISAGVRIFLREGALTPKAGVFCNFLPKTAWKCKNLDPNGNRNICSVQIPIPIENKYNSQFWS